MLDATTLSRHVFCIVGLRFAYFSIKCVLIKTSLLQFDKQVNSDIISSQFMEKMKIYYILLVLLLALPFLLKYVVLPTKADTPPTPEYQRIDLGSLGGGDTEAR